jgi:hypothetical protein
MNTPTTMSALCGVLFCFFAICGSAFAFVGEPTVAVAILGGSLPLGILALLFDWVEQS